MNSKIYALAASLLILLGGCSDDTPIPEPRPGGSIENVDGTRVTILHLSLAGNEGWNPVNDATFRLIDPVNRHTFDFTGALLHDPDIQVLGNRGAATCRIAIGAEDIPDGTYYISVSGEGVPSLGTRLVRFSSNIGTEEADSPMDYEDLEGGGTIDNPYLINDAGDFLTLLWYLDEDPTHACGRYFRQTSSFEVPRRSQIIDGHIWMPVTFSGNYNGGGYELQSLTYQGASDPQADSNVGLFKELYSATVENLSMTGALIINASSNVGIVAGKCSGSNYFTNITLGGTVMASGDNIGGLAGEVNGHVSIKGITLKSLVVSGNDSQGGNVGGIVGSFSDGSFRLDGLSTPDHIFSITGHDNVGGLAGRMATNVNIELSDITLEHSVDRESSGVKVIYGSGLYTGGLIGCAIGGNPIMFDNISIKAPVRGKQDVAALTGHADNITNINVSSTVLSSVVSGGLTTGGFFGYLKLAGSNSKLTFGGPAGSNRFIIKSSAAADVEGDTHTGGLIGYLAGNKGKVQFDSRVEMAVNVSGKEETGGAVGYMADTDGFDLEGINFSSRTMRVTSSGSYAGGYFGKATSCTVSGSIKLDLYNKIPTQEYLPGHFGGVVTAANYAGGIVGSYTGTLTGAGGDAEVTATADFAGGICGYFDGTIKHCAFTGDVTSPGCVAGIYAKCTKQVYVSDCLNLADIKGGTYQAGIAAYTRTPHNTSIRIDRSYNCGDLTGGATVGGIAAYVGEECPIDYLPGNKFIDITNNGNSGDIYATGDSHHSVGGIVGKVDYIYAHVYYCANHGDVGSSTVQFTIGGVVGEFGIGSAHNCNTVSQCMNSGTVTCDVASTKIGGVVGHLQPGTSSRQAVLCDSYNIGAMPTDQKDDTGGILGYASHNTNTYRHFNRGKISHGNAIIGTHGSGSLFNHSHNYYLEGTGWSWPSSTSVKKDKIGDKASYPGFDFDNTWDITSDGPVLRNCPFQFND